MSKTITAGLTIAVVGALILASITTIGTARVHEAVLQNHANRHEWAVSAIRRNEDRIGKAESELQTGMAILVRIEDHLKRIEEKLEKK